jgi:hypothetical protein
VQNSLERLTRALNQPPRDGDSWLVGLEERHQYRVVCPASRSASPFPDVQVECGMFGLFQRRKDAIEAQAESESGRSTEAVVKSDPPEALNVTGPDCKIDRETVVALNVKVVCDLAGLLPDKAKYEVLRDQAIGMALSIQNGTYREFAVDHVAGLCRRCGDAKELLDRVTDESLRERILKTCPELRHMVWSPPATLN